MRKSLSRLLLSTICLASALMAGSVAVAADQMRWPRESALPRPVQQPAPPPAVLERAPSAVAYNAELNRRRAASVCKPETACVVCVAACDTQGPVLIQALKPKPIGVIPAASTENDSDGVAPNAPKYARQDWAGITCGSVGGCSVSGVSAPRRRSIDIDVRMTVFSPFMGSDGSTSRYIDR